MIVTGCLCCVYSLGMISGAVGSFIGTPAEISLIRMTSDGRSAELNQLKPSTPDSAKSKLINFPK